MLIITVKPRDEHNVLDPPTELIAHLPHPIHNLVWFALRKVCEGTYALPGVHNDDLTWAPFVARAVLCEVLTTTAYEYISTLQKRLPIQPWGLGLLASLRTLS